jgi:fructokinase
MLLKNQKQIKALTFGEALFDIIKGSAHLGGAPLNLAMHLAKLGANPAIITAVGRDELGKILLTKAKEVGVDTSYILIDRKRPTGTVTVKLEDEGIPVFTINKGVAWDAITLNEKQYEAVKEKKWDVFCFGTLAQRTADNRKTLKKLFSEIQADYFFYDVNLRAGFYTKEWIISSLEQCTILKMNEEEAAIVSNFVFGSVQSCETICRELIKKYPKISIICISKGPKGASVFQNGVYEEVKTIPIKVADTVGAGDAFSAAFLYTLLRTQSPGLAARAGNINGAYAASHAGAIPKYTPQHRKALEV